MELKVYWQAFLRRQESVTGPGCVLVLTDQHAGLIAALGPGVLRGLAPGSAGPLVGH
jgi:hypothetical protein